MSYASVYEQTHSRQCCNLFISWLWTQPMIVLPSVAHACDDQSTVHLDWQLGGYTSSSLVRNVWAINRVLLRISIWFSCQFAGLHVANRAVIHFCYCCADVWSVLAYFVANSVAHVHRQAGQVRSGHQERDSACICRSFRDAPGRSTRSTVAVAAPARLRLICHKLCTGAYLTTDELSAVSYHPLSQSRHSAGDRSTKAGNNINWILAAVTHRYLI